MTNKIKNNDFMDIITNRHAIRKYDTSVKISKDEMKEILEEATKAPSAMNLQPWRFLVIESEEGKATLAPLTPNKLQLETSSAVIAIFGDLNRFEYLEGIYGKAVELGFMDAKAKEIRMEKYKGFQENTTVESNKNAVLVDGGLVAMQLMLVACARGYDTCAIGAFDKEKITEAFGMDKERYVPVLLISIGKADETAPQSVRLPIDEIAEWK